MRLTRLGQEEQEQRLQSGRNRTETDHPAPSTMRVLESSIDTVCDDLTTGDHDDIDYDHAAAETGRRELLNVQRGHTRSNSDTDTDEETAANLGSTIQRLSKIRLRVLLLGNHTIDQTVWHTA